MQTKKRTSLNDSLTLVFSSFLKLLAASVPRMKIKGAVNAAAFRTSRRMQTGATGPAESTDSAPPEKNVQKIRNYISIHFQRF